MKKKLIYLIGVMVAISLVSVIIINTVIRSTSYEQKDEDRIDLVASFYPMYIIGLNLLDGIDEFQIISLTSGYIGCLHDYQLTTDDMKKISTADIFLMNGGGMEVFMDTVMNNYPNLYTMNASDGIEMLSSDLEEHQHEHEDEYQDHEDAHQDEHEHNHSEYNAHVWLDPQKYMIQIENTKNELMKYINGNIAWDEATKVETIAKLENNTRVYLDKIQKVDHKLISLLEENRASIEKDNQEGVVVFHDAFVYIAERLGLHVARSIEIEQDTQLSPKEIAEIVDEINEDKINYLFTEKQYGDKIAVQIQAETGVKVIQIDSAVTGESDKDAYINAMEFNIEVLKEMLQ